MSTIHPAAVEHQRKRWIRPDAYRFAPPGTPEAKPPGYLHPWAAVARLEEAAEDEARARAVAEQDAFEREVLALRHDFAKLKLEYELRRFQQKYSPDQPRDDRGRWTDSGAGVSGGANDGTHDDNAAPQDGGALAQDRGLPRTAASDQTPRNDLPQLQAIANDPVIRAHMNEAWNASNPNGISPREHGFWISQDEISGQLFTRPFANPGVANEIVPGSPPPDAIAFFHTHPFGGLVLGLAGPSPGDEIVAQQLGLPGLIQSHVGMYYFGPALRPRR